MTLIEVLPLLLSAAALGVSLGVWSWAKSSRSIAKDAERKSESLESALCDADLLEFDAECGYFSPVAEEFKEVVEFTGPGVSHLIEDATDKADGALKLALSAKSRAGRAQKIAEELDDLIARKIFGEEKDAAGIMRGGLLDQVAELKRQLASIRTGLALTAGVDPREPEERDAVSPEDETETNIQVPIELLDNERCELCRNDLSDGVHGEYCPAKPLHQVKVLVDPGPNGHFGVAIEDSVELPLPMRRFATEGE